MRSFVIENYPQSTDKQHCLLVYCKTISKERDAAAEVAATVTQVAVEFSHLKAMKQRSFFFLLKNDTGAIKNCKTAEDGKMISAS